MGTGRLVQVWVRVQVRVRYRYGTGTVRVRYGYGRYGTWVRYMVRKPYHVPYPCTVPTVPVPCTQIAAEIRTMYPNSGRNSSRSATISAAIWVHGTGTVGTVHGYGTWVRYMGTVFVPMYRTHVPYRPYPCIVPVPYPYRTCTVPAPVPAPKPVPTVPYLSFGIPSCFQNGQ